MAYIRISGGRNSKNFIKKSCLTLNVISRNATNKPKPTFMHWQKANYVFVRESHMLL